MSDRPIGVDPDSTTWPIVLAFAIEMEKKLAMNLHKGDRDGWLKDEPFDLLARVVEEVLELQHAVDKGVPSDEVIQEAADVANMALMTADRYALQWSSRGLLERLPAAAEGQADA